MGNVPLPSPPKATQTKAVAHITTRPLHGTLRLIPSRDACAEKISVLGLPDEEVASKLEKLEDRITRYRAGRMNLAVGVLALVIVLIFVVGMFFRWFWESFLFANPIYLISVAAFEVILGFFASYVEKREISALLSDIEGIFEDWWEEPNAVRVTVQRVYGTYPQQDDSRRCFKNRQGKFISISFQREDDTESVGMTRTMDTQSVDY